MLGVLGHMSTPLSTYILCVVECPINLHSFLAFRMGGPAKKQACEGGHVQLMYQHFMVWINWTRRWINWTRCPIDEPSLVQLIYLAFSTMFGVLGHMSTPCYDLLAILCVSHGRSFKKQACKDGLDPSILGSEGVENRVQLINRA